MARLPRVQFPGALYHVTARGVAAETIYQDDSDRRLFLSQLSDVVGRYSWICHGYCLMGTHYHLVVETPAANLAAGAQRLNGVYGQSFNRFHGRKGHLFQGRYGAVLVQKETHLLEVSRYVALNPVRAGLCRTPEEWEWSSHRATVGLADRPAFLTVDWLLGLMSPIRGAALDRYRTFVAEGLPGAESLRPRSGYLGSDEFVQRFIGSAGV